MLPSSFEPMLAHRKNPKLERLKFPVYVSPKFDGIRCVGSDNTPFSRTLKLIPNRKVQGWFASDPRINGLDGELLAGSPTAPNAMQNSSKAIMSGSAPAADVIYYVFDRWDMPTAPFSERYESLLAADLPPWVVVVPHVLVHNIDELLAEDEKNVQAGYEGSMINSPDGLYKQGRSTEREGLLLKLKRFEDTEAVIIGVNELMHNGNEAYTNEVGRTKRSTAKDGMVPGDTLGSLQCKCEEFTDDFGLGSGIDDDLAKELWAQRDSLIGRVVTFKYQPHGSKDAPRCPVFKALRDDL